MSELAASLIGRPLTPDVLDWTDWYRTTACDRRTHLMQRTPNHPRGLPKLALSMTPELRTILSSYTEHWIDTYDLLQDLLLQLLGRDGHDSLTARERIRQLAHAIGGKWRCATQSALTTQTSLTALHGNVDYTDDTPESVFESERCRELLREVISEFPRRQRQAWQLVKFEGRSCKEAARTMNVSPGTIQVYMRDGMIVCRRRLQAQGGSYEV
jgi:RNA polymerase sigma factor (sigma-70 family)